jgi:thiamine-phosphate pyrophosphorylase
MGPLRLFSTVERALDGVQGERIMVIDRERPPAAGGSSDRRRLARLTKLRELTHRTGSTLVVNSRVDLALAANADGVQLPEKGLSAAIVRRTFPSLLVGRSCHDRLGLLEAASEGAHWALLSPVAAPLSKASDLPTLGIDGFAELQRECGLPTFALGGIQPSLIPQLLQAGARGVAVIGYVLGASDPGAALREVSVDC